MPASAIAERILSVAPSKRSHRGIAPEIRKLKLKYPELTDSEIARKVGCDPSNVSQVLKTFLGKHTSDDLRDYQDNQADIFDSVAMRLLSSVSQKKIDKTPAVQAITGAAILIDKARLVRGQATGINVNVLLDVAEAIRSKRSGISTIDATTVDHGDRTTR
jgi:hypothetical protein